MSNFVGLITGGLLILLGFFILINNKKVSRALQPSYDQIKNKYDLRASKAKGVNKLLTFILFKPGTYYMNDGETSNVIKILSPFIIILGGMLILFSLGVINS